MKFITEQINQLRRAGLLRQFKTISAINGAKVKIGGKWYVSFCSNDYLGLAQHPALRKAAQDAVRRFGVGSGASRLMAGTLTPHYQLEKAIARFIGAQEALLFTSGFVANLAVITTLIKEGDVVFSDEFNHASLIDAIRLTRAKSFVYRHRDMAHLEALLKSSRSKLFPNHEPRTANYYIITDAIFSMDGDAAPLVDIVRLAKKYKCYTIVDEAHATGVFGKHGRGLAEHLELSGKIDISIGTLSKAAGVIGGFVTGSKDFIAYIRSKGRPFIFTTSLPPADCAAAIEAINIIRTRPGLRRQLWAKTDYVKSRLAKYGFDLWVDAKRHPEVSGQGSASPIIPVLIGDPKKTLKVSEYLWRKGLFIPAIRPPTVPADKSRLRITISTLHNRVDLDYLIMQLVKAKQQHNF
ncbi:MAG: 8-amino-7-oxononanoate synthase [Planctomycetota bacterium]